MDNLEVPLFTDLATINGSVTKIVTKGEILALVSLLLGAYFMWYWPTDGDILTDNHSIILYSEKQIIKYIYEFIQSLFGVKTTKYGSEHADVWLLVNYSF